MCVQLSRLDTGVMQSSSALEPEMRGVGRQLRWLSLIPGGHGQSPSDPAAVDRGVTEGGMPAAASQTGAEHGVHRTVQVHRAAQLRPGAFCRGPKSGITEDQIRHGTHAGGCCATQPQPRSEL